MQNTAQEQHVKAFSVLFFLAEPLQSACSHCPPLFCPRWTSLLYVRDVIVLRMLQPLRSHCQTQHFSSSKRVKFKFFEGANDAPQDKIFVCLEVLLVLLKGLKWNQIDCFLFFPRSQRTVRRICEVFHVVLFTVRREYLIHRMLLNFQKY